jgi:hypothetical protein
MPASITASLVLIFGAFLLRATGQTLLAVVVLVAAVIIPIAAIMRT